MQRGASARVAKENPKRQIPNAKEIPKAGKSEVSEVPIRASLAFGRLAFGIFRAAAG
jgi:hypothetical protein